MLKRWSSECHQIYLNGRVVTELDKVRCSLSKRNSEIESFIQTSKSLRQQLMFRPEIAPLRGLTQIRLLWVPLDSFWDAFPRFGQKTGIWPHYFEKNRRFCLESANNRLNFASEIIIRVSFLFIRFNRFFIMLLVWFLMVDH